jgi:large subunit ribosomal protein L28
MPKCDICDKSMTTGHRISITRSRVSRRANRTWKPNVKKVQVVENGTVKTIHVCTRCLRSNKVQRAL